MFAYLSISCHRHYTLHVAIACQATGCSTFVKNLVFTWLKKKIGIKCITFQCIGSVAAFRASWFGACPASEALFLFHYVHCRIRLPYLPHLISLGLQTFFFLLLLQSQTFASNFACNSWQFWYRRTCFEQVNSTIFHSSKTSQCEPSLLSAAPVLHLQLNLWSAYVSIKCAYGTKNSYSLVLASLACISFFLQRCWFVSLKWTVWKRKAVLLLANWTSPQLPWLLLCMFVEKLRSIWFALCVV